MKQASSIVRRFWWVLVILFAVLAVAYSNHIPGTILSGWDALHPEFDLSNYTARVLNGAWQEHQGVGAPPSQAHVAELVRLPILWILGLILPMNLVRYSFLFLMIFVGCWGVTIFINSIKFKESNGHIPGLLGAIFYLLSLISVQQFYVPLEMFAVHYAVVPWLMMSLYFTMVEGNRKWIGWFVILSVVGAPQAHTATLYYVLIGLMGILVIAISLGAKSISYFRQGLLALILGVVVNLYWIGPNVYYLATQGVNVVESKIHSSFTPEAVLQNQAYGDVEEIIVGRNFLFNWFDYSFKDGKFYPLLNAWQVSNGPRSVSIAMSSLSVLALIGLLFMMLKRDDHRKLGIGFATLLVISTFFLINDNPPTGRIFRYLIEKLPMIAEGLRFPFTKFSIVYLLLMAMGFGLFWKYIFSFVTGKINRIFLAIGITAVFVFTYSPAFSGGYVSRNMQVEIPQEYFELFKFMRTQSIEGRVVDLPIPNYWGWVYNDWTKYGYANGYQGAGFMWFGIRQPLLNREFDRWSPYNETFYHAFSTAVYGGDGEVVRRVLRKYDVRYVLLDESVIAPGQDNQILRIPETKVLMEEIGAREVWKTGFLTVWDMGKQGEQFVSAPKEYTVAEGDTEKVRKDVIAQDVGTYVSGIEGAVTHPFAGMMKEEIENVSYTEDDINLDADGQLRELGVPGFKRGERVEMGYSLRLKEGALQLDWEPLYKINEQQGPKLTSRQWVVASEGESVWVSIGEREVYVTTDKPVREVARLVVGEPIEIKIYEGRGVEEKVELGERQDCGEKKEFSCWAIALSPQKRDSLVQTITHFAGTISPDVCLDLEGEPYECLNDQRRGDDPLVVTRVVEKGEKYWLDYVVKDEGTVMRSPGVVWYPLIEQKLIDGDEWMSMIQEQKFELQGEALRVEVQSEPTIFDFARVGKAGIDNCDILGRGTAEKVGSRYLADERGAACDYVEMSSLDSRVPYLMRVKGEDIAGRSLKYFLYNTTSKRNDLEYLLDKGKFDQTFVLLPWTYPGSYSLNIETRSFGQKTENVLERVEVRYFPLSQIAGMRSAGGQPKLERSDLKIVRVRKTGTWLYRVKTKGEGLLRLSQGYDEGWVGWGFQHVKVDGWANGWVVDQGGEQEMMIFFWPQLLEYLGFAMLGVTALMCFGRKKRGVN